MKFTVYEVWTRSKVVEADSESDALRRHSPEPIPGMSLCNWCAWAHEPVEEPAETLVEA